MSTLVLKTKINSILLSALGFECIDIILANAFVGKQNVYLQTLDGSNHFSGTKEQWIDFIDDICHLSDVYFDEMSQETVLHALSRSGISSGYYEFNPEVHVDENVDVKLMVFPATTILSARINAEHALRSQRFSS